MGLPESREARYTMRGKPQTSWWRAEKVAADTLVVRYDPSIIRTPDPNRTRIISEEVLARGWKPQKPMIYALLDLRPFQSKENFLMTLETDYVPPIKEAKRISVQSPRASDMRAMEFGKLLAAFDDV